MRFAIIATILLLCGTAHAKTEADYENEFQRYNDFWNKEMFKADKQGPAFVTGELTREVTERKRSLGFERNRSQLLNGPELVIALKYIYANEGIITERTAELNRRNQIIIEQYQRAKAERETAEAEKLAEQAANSDALAKRVELEVEQERQQAEYEELKEAAVARANQKTAETWAHANCGSLPENIPAGITNFIKENAHNPASVKLRDCETPVFTTGCWEVKCSYRATNPLGALMLSTQKFYIGQGKISTSRIK